ncbi:hypothetical protein GCM10010518_45380 [Kitasatospora cinereorecta]
MDVEIRRVRTVAQGRNPSGKQKAAAPVRPVLPPSGTSRYLREARASGQISYTAPGTASSTGPS